MTKAEALRLAAVLKAAWPREKVGSDTLQVYAQYLQDVPFEAAKAATDRLICSRKWFPTIAEIRAELAEAECAALPDPEVAWGEVLRAISRYGSYRTPEFEHPELAAAVDSLGWRNICLDENVMSTRARFIDAYRTIRERRVAGHQLGAYAPPERRLAGREGGQKQLGAALRVVTGDGE